MENESLLQQREEDELNRFRSGQAFNYKLNTIQIFNWKVMIGLIKFLCFSIYAFGTSYAFSKIIIPMYEGLFVHKESFGNLMSSVGINALAFFIGAMTYFYLIRYLIKDYEKYVRKQIKMHQMLKARIQKEVVEISCSKPEQESTEL